MVVVAFNLRCCAGIPGAWDEQRKIEEGAGGGNGRQEDGAGGGNGRQEEGWVNHVRNRQVRA